LDSQSGTRCDVDIAVAAFTVQSSPRRAGALPIVILKSSPPDEIRKESSLRPDRPTVKPVILRMVYQCARAVTLPVVGCGGIFSVEDAVEYMLASAAAVQVGTANFIHPTTMIDIIDALPRFLARHGLVAASRLTGAVRADEAADPLWATAG
jgi:hypothetical protein